MKLLKLFSLLLAFVLFSCTAVRVTADYDKEANFGAYKTFAFYKPGIDKVKISDLDKKRILRAIEKELLAKGFTKSNKPDIMVNIFTKTQENINVYSNVGFGYGWGPWYGGYSQNVSRDTQGTLYIDFIDGKDKQLVWQGKGQGYLTHNQSKKEDRITEFVSKILERYPPELIKE
jgi:hypothetical protein